MDIIVIVNYDFFFLDRNKTSGRFQELSSFRLPALCLTEGLLLTVVSVGTLLSTVVTSRFGKGSSGVSQQ